MFYKRRNAAHFYSIKSFYIFLLKTCEEIKVTNKYCGRIDCGMNTDNRDLRILNTLSISYILAYE
ncbi:hypothetical protein Avbf_08161 [Armadillidium vulgare]|nr:hypothetical protein Avbf_08161 [Armadillidium vulgare]